ncbi:hypothetical protein MMC21_007826 [Puttea exsequens]|nr:hypothetical protein [Puttea exsequens]
MTQLIISGTNGADRRLRRRKHIAHKLLIELLACQFAFPVRWIETQDTLFSNEDVFSRFIEIGPAKVLARMAKQTVDTKYADRDVARGIQRTFLSSKADEKEVQYEYESAEQEGDLPSSQMEPTSSSAATAPAAIEQPKPSVSISSPAPVAQVPDVPVSAREIILSLVARKFNKAFDEISMGKSIKELTGGKSTLQNELVGLLEAEFSNLPAGPEDLSIPQLGEGVQQNFSGSLGKESSRLVSRFFSAKMPAGFAQSEARSYLEEKWGVGSGRQTSILLLAVTAEPASRLPSLDYAKEFIDSITTRYASVTGTSLSKATTSQGQQSAANSMVDSKQIDELREEHNGHLSKQFNILAEHLGVDRSHNQKIQELEPLEQEHRSKLNIWSAEFEDEFEAGIQPAFDTRKIRRLNCWWNNVRQDVISLFHETQKCTYPMNDFILNAKILQIANRGDAFVCKLVRHLHSLTEASPMITGGFGAIAGNLLAAADTAKDEDPVFKFTHRSMAPETFINQAGDIVYREVSRQADACLSYPRLLRRDFSVVNGDQCQPFVDINCRIGNQWQFDSAKTETLLQALDIGGSSGISFARKDILVTGAGPNSIGAEVLRGLLMGGARVIVTSSRPPAETKDFFQSIYAEYGARGSELTMIQFNQGSKRDCTALINHIYSESGMDRNLDAIIPFAAISERAEIDEIDGRSELAHRLMLVNVLRMLGDIVRNKHARKLNSRPTQVLLPLSPNHGIFGGDGLYAESKLGLESLLSRFHSETWSDYLHICGAVIGWTRGTELMGDNDMLAQAIESHGGLTFSQREMAFNLLTLLSGPVAEMCELESILVNLNGGLDDVPDLKNLLIKTRGTLNQESSIRKAIIAEDLLEEKVLGTASDVPVLDDHVDQQPRRSTIRVGYPVLPKYESDIAPLQHLEGMVDLSSVPVVVGFSELGPWGSARTRWEMESRGTFSQEGYVEMAWMMNIIKHFSGEKEGKHYAGWVDAKTSAVVQDSQVGELYGRQILEHSGVRVVEPDLLGGYDPGKKEYLQEVAIEEALPEFDASPAEAEAFKLHHGDKVSIRHVEGSDDHKVQLKRGASLRVSKAVPFEGFVAGQIPTGWDARKYGLPEDIVRQVDPVTAYALCCAAEALYSAGFSDGSEILQHIHISEVGNFIGSMMGGTTKTRNMYKDQYLDKDVQGDVMQETYLSTSAAWINMLLLGAAGPIKTPTGACATSIESIDNACESLLSGKTKMCFVGGTDDFQEDESYAFRTMNATVNAEEEFAKGRLPCEMSRPTSESRAGFVEGQGCGVQIVTTADLALSLGLPIYGVIAASTMAADKISRSVPAPGQGVLSFARQTAEASRSSLLNMDYRRCEMKAAIERAQVWRTGSLHKAYRNANKHARFFTDSENPGEPEEDGSESSTSLKATISTINRSTNSQIKDIQRLWGNDFRRQHSDISPLGAALATWGLTIDDVDFASLHATSTKANDKNEPDIINKQMNHLNRTMGNPLLAICQKSVTGHPKAPAAAFMLNGCLQALDTGLIPGNRNADNVDPILSAFPHLTFPTRPIQATSLKAFSLTCFGFGQKGGQLIGIHPRYLYGTIDRPSYESYIARVTKRTRFCNRAYLYAMLENRIVACKAAPQYTPADQDAVLLDPRSRISAETPSGEPWRFQPNRMRFDQLESDSTSETERQTSESDSLSSSTSQTYTSPTTNSSGLSIEMMGTKTWLDNAAARVQRDQNISVGIDVEDSLSSVDADLQGTFAQRNYTAGEIAVAKNSTDRRRALTGRWSAKEAVFKSLGVQGKGAGAALKDIEILPGKEGGPIVKLHGDAYTAAQKEGITDIQLSLSHSNNAATAVALAIKGSGEASY